MSAITKLEMIDISRRAENQMCGRVTAAIAKHVLSSATDTWPWFADDEGREALKTLRDGYKGKPHVRLVEFLTATRDCGSAYWRHTITWMRLPQSVRNAFNIPTGIRYVDCEDEFGEISDAGILENLWTMLHYELRQSVEEVGRQDLAVIGRAKLEILPLMRAISQLSELVPEDGSHTEIERDIDMSEKPLPVIRQAAK